MSHKFINLDADIMTHSGKYFPFFKPEEYDFDIFTIAHALSKLCRFTGHTRRFYSVAQHSVLVSRILPPEHQKAGLLHDAAEAFIGDMSKPLKDLFPEFKRIEEAIEEALFAQFGIPFPMQPEIKHADLVLLATEQRDLLPPIESQWALLAGIEPMDDVIEPWTPEEAYKAFIRRFVNLFFGWDEHPQATVRPNLVTDEERKNFEAWMGAFFPSTSLKRGADGRYLSEDTEFRWQKKRSRASQERGGS